MTTQAEDRRAGGAPDAQDDAPDALADEAGPGRESISDVLASIRALVSEESRARQAAPGTDLATVLVLTPAMRADDAPGAGHVHSGEILSEGLDLRGARGQPAPILDEEALRDVINVLVREELQGELGDRISRNLRKLIRREMAQMLEEQRAAGDLPRP